MLFILTPQVTTLKFFCVEIMCPHIPDPRNGQIVFSEDNIAPFVEGTMAIYSCYQGYSLKGGDAMRSCVRNESTGDGMWNGEAPVCQGMFYALQPAAYINTCLYACMYNYVVYFFVKKFCCVLV